MVRAIPQPGPAQAAANSGSKNVPELLDAGTLPLTSPTKSNSMAAPSSTKPIIAFIFPGLGGELYPPLAELYTLGTAFRETVELADRITAKRLGFKVSEILERQNSKLGRVARARLFRGGQPQSVQSTVTAHSALFTVECALANTWMDIGVRPSLVAGYSLGEYAAACIAGLLSFEDALSLVIGRAECLGSLPRTGMIAVSGSFDQISEYIEPGVHLVAANSSAQTVLGGACPDLTRTLNALRRENYMAQELPVEHAFHTPLMKAACPKLAALFASIQFHPFQLQMISSLNGNSISFEEASGSVHWTRHLCEPIHLRQAVDTLETMGTGIFLEVGPGQTLSPLIEAHLSGRGFAIVAASLPSVFDERPATEHFLRTTDRLRAAGTPSTDSTGVYSPSPGSQCEPEGPVYDRGLVAELQELWSEILGNKQVLPDDNLFDLGGNSLNCAKLAMRIKRDRNIELSLREIFSAPTPRKLAAAISDGLRLQKSHSDLLVLPNGLRVLYQSRAEALYFYKSIFEDRGYTRYGLRICPGATVFDVGANIGLFSIFASLEAVGVSLYSFEPVPPLFDILKYNLHDFCDDAALFNVGLSDISGMGDITYYPNSPGMSSFEPSRREEQAVLEALLRNSYAGGDKEAGEALLDPGEFMNARFLAKNYSCELLTLSDVFRKSGIRKVDFLKIDVQKFELKVLQGIADSDWSIISQVSVEIHDHGGRVRDISNFLEARGFAVNVEQDSLYRSTPIFMLYAARIGALNTPGEGAAL